MSTITANEKWVDGKRYLWLLSPAIPVLACIALFIGYTTNWTYAFLIVPLVVYALIPALDFIFGTDNTNPPEDAIEGLEQDKYYRAIVFGYIPSQFIATAFGAYLAVEMDLAIWEYVGLVLSVGGVNGIAINTAHELGHKKEAIEKFLAKLCLAPTFYGHFETEHNKGHHVHVSTPHDPATSRLGENFWTSFLPKTVSGSIKSAWGIEKQRLERKGLSVWSTQNENLRAWAMSVALYGVLTALLGWPALLFLVLQGIYGFSLLEVVNYLEHYGLLRKKLPNGRYERCKPEHSWNSNHIVTNIFLYQLQRHSDHHANPVRRYQALRDFKDSPQLPSGYASMMVLAMIPPLWYKVMDKRVLAHYDGDITKAHIFPGKRDQILRKYGGEEAIARFEEGQSIQSDSTVEAIKAKASAAKAVETTKYICLGDRCGFIYDEVVGNEKEGFAPGTKFSEIPDNWACPDCGVREKVDFIPYTGEEKAS